MPSDIEIARDAILKPIGDIAAQLGIPPESVENYGRYKAKISLDYIQSLEGRPDGKLILVTALSPTPAGEGKTTTTVGLGDALNKIGKKAIICLREPSLGPVFGLKGGAAGGGYAQVVPMEDINLHFTGDFGAIGLAHNLLAALIDNHIHHGNELGFDVRRITWRRVVDMNDRALRNITVGLGGPANGFPRQDGFDIVVASEVMAIVCLSRSLADLKRNLVQTLENNPAFIHGGPFANIAHGCNSVLATQTALKLADYVVTEAGFGADLGAEKFIDIKCRKSGLRPAAVVIVATIRALKYHGGCDLSHINEENLAALEKGLGNLARHAGNIRDQYGLPCMNLVQTLENNPAFIHGGPFANIAHGCNSVLATQTALKLADYVVTEAGESRFRFVYDDERTLWDKVKTIATKIYGAADISADTAIRRQFDKLQADGYGRFPVCIAKTQYSFSTDPALRGAPSGHMVNIREVRLAAGAEFVVVVCGDVMTMPGLPKVPSSEAIDIDDQGRVIGVF